MPSLWPYSRAHAGHYEFFRVNPPVLKFSVVPEMDSNKEWVYPTFVMPEWRLEFFFLFWHVDTEELKDLDAALMYASKGGLSFSELRKMSLYDKAEFLDSFEKLYKQISPKNDENGVTLEAE